MTKSHDISSQKILTSYFQKEIFFSESEIHEKSIRFIHCKIGVQLSLQNSEIDDTFPWTENKALKSLKIKN